MEEEYLEDIEEPWWKGPIKYILGIALVLLIILWYFPSQAIKLDPEPTYDPTIEEVLPRNIQLSNTTFKIESQYDYLKPIFPSDILIKQISNKIAALACDGSKVCQAKAIYYFIRDNYDYISDPIGVEYVESPSDFLITGGGDCESGAITMAALMESIGIKTQLVLVLDHALIRIYLDDVLKRYKHVDNYVYLDWTCETCKFGQAPQKDFSGERTIIG